MQVGYTPVSGNLYYSRFDALACKFEGYGGENSLPYGQKVFRLQVKHPTSNKWGWDTQDASGQYLANYGIDNGGLADPATDFIEITDSAGNIINQGAHSWMGAFQNQGEINPNSVFTGQNNAGTIGGSLGYVTSTLAGIQPTGQSILFPMPYTVVPGPHVSFQPSNGTIQGFPMNKYRAIVWDGGVNANTNSPYINTASSNNYEIRVFNLPCQNATGTSAAGQCCSNGNLYIYGLPAGSAIQQCQ